MNEKVTHEIQGGDLNSIDAKAGATGTGADL
jgi:hypothetical protein